MKEQSAYVILPTGRLEKWVITRQAVNATESIAAQFTKSLPVKIPAAFEVRGMPFNLHLETGNPGNYNCLCKIKSLPLRVALVPSPIAKKEDNIMVPDLAESSVKTIDMVWTPPDNCLLVYMVQIHWRTPYHYATNNYLYAYSDTGIYKLPLGNLYDDCKICTGDYNSRCNTISEVAKVSMDQFINSRWNTHLIRELDRMHRMFRWKATPDSFDQMPTDGNWKTLSTKVSVPYANYVVELIGNRNDDVAF